MSSSSAMLHAPWYLLVTAHSVSVQKLRRKHGRWSCEGLGCSSRLSEMRLEFIMVQQAGGDVENCLGKVKGTEQKGKLNMGKYMFFPLVLFSY